MEKQVQNDDAKFKVNKKYPPKNEPLLIYVILVAERTNHKTAGRHLGGADVPRGIVIFLIILTLKNQIQDYR